MTVPINFRRSTVPDILVLHKNTLKPSEWQTIAGYRVTTPTRTLFDIFCSDIPKGFVNQVVREGLSRGLFPNQKLKKYKLIERVNTLR